VLPLSPRFASACAVLTTLLGLGCAGDQWAPPAPAGVTYQYDYQGFRERNTTVVAGTVTGDRGMGAAFAGVFSFQDDSELRGREVADPFAESALIDGVRFNSHLATAGIPVTPPPPPASSSPEPPPASSAWPSQSAPPPAPGGFL